MNNLKIEEIINTLEIKKKELSKARDELREYYSEIENILDSFGEGIEGIKDAKNSILNAIDEISKYV